MSDTFACVKLVLRKTNVEKKVTTLTHLVIRFIFIIIIITITISFFAFSHLQYSWLVSVV